MKKLRAWWSYHRQSESGGIWIGIKQAAWSLLPDRCEVPKMVTPWTCSRRGVRGNENLIEYDGELRRMCDDCHVHHGAWQRRADSGAVWQWWNKDGSE